MSNDRALLGSGVHGMSDDGVPVGSDMQLMSDNEPSVGSVVPGMGTGGAPLGRGMQGIGDDGEVALDIYLTFPSLSIQMSIKRQLLEGWM